MSKEKLLENYCSRPLWNKVKQNKLFLHSTVFTQRYKYNASVFSYQIILKSTINTVQATFSDVLLCFLKTAKQPNVNLIELNSSCDMVHIVLWDKSQLYITRATRKNYGYLPASGWVSRGIVVNRWQSEKDQKHRGNHLLRTTGGLGARQDLSLRHFSVGLPLLRANNNNNKPT